MSRSPGGDADGGEAAQTDLLFVYGTLRRGCPAFHILEGLGAVFVGDGSVQGRLLDLGPYPGLVPSEKRDDQVRGEVYRLSSRPRTLVVLDRYEGCGPRDPEPRQFERERVVVELDDGLQVRAWVYVYQGLEDGRPRVRSGEWTR